MKCSLPEAAAPAQLGSAVFLFAFFFLFIYRSLAPPSRPNPQQYRERRAREQATGWYDAARDFANVLFV